MDNVERSAREEYVESDGACIWTATQGQGEALVLLHGGPGGSDQLQPVADMVDDLAQVHRYEQRGCGRSTGGPAYTVERWLDDLEQLRIHWKHPWWIVFGHSFGAELALAYAASFSSRARAIIYMSCLPAVLADRRGQEEFVLTAPLGLLSRCGRVSSSFADCVMKVANTGHRLSRPNSLA
jgi:pimeloyl-ACP methyl ester carboxylesterase